MRMHQVMQEVDRSNPVSRAIFRTAYESKRRAISRGDLSGGASAPLWNALVFSKVKAKLGGRVRLLTTGASPISAEVMAFLRVCFPGAMVLEGYGVKLSLKRRGFHFCCARFKGIVNSRDLPRSSSPAPISFC
jgi:long-subunit acyl-CoA synthetase (AMP-forming)